MRLLIFTAIALLIEVAAASASPRVALVIGNGAYFELGSLDNPISDARLVADTLDGLGFETTLVLDANQRTMSDAIAGFGRALRAGGRDAVGLFYFAGHGIQGQ